jgi:hypothetical protein
MLSFLNCSSVLMGLGMVTKAETLARSLRCAWRGDFRPRPYHLFILSFWLAVLEHDEFQNKNAEFDKQRADLLSKATDEAQAFNSVL